jgi:flagellar biosynthesis protein FliR
MQISIAQAQLFFLALTRVLSALIAIPILGGQTIPTNVRISFGIVLTLILIPWQSVSPDAQEISFIGFAVAILKELIIGMLIGFAASLTFATMQIVGEVMGFGSGFASSRIFNPAISETGTAFDQLFTIVAMMVFMVIDGHHLVILALGKTFEMVPINGPLPVGSLEMLARMTAQLIMTGIQLALPVMVALTITDIGLGLVARVAPRIQIYFLGLPLKVGVSLFALGSLMLIIFPALRNLYGAMGNRMLQLIGK